MPTLNRRNDGLYFVRHFYGDHSTWQVTSEGVRFLEFRGIGEGSYFTTTLFMEMVVQGLIYTGQGPKPGFRGGTRSPTLPDAMSAIVRDFHRALVKGDVQDVSAALWLPPSDRVDPGSIRKLVENDLSDWSRRPRTWKLKDLVTYELPIPERPNYGGADALTAIRVRLGIQESTVEVTEYWLPTDGGWRVCWGFLTSG